MLIQLAIRNLATIESTALDLGEGLNIISGSTGAGKSILIDGLKLVLGGRARADMVRHGTTKAEVEALFRIPQDHPVASRLRDMDLVEEPSEDDVQELVIRRTLSAAGKGRVTVNGRLSNVTLLARLMRGMVDISSQHAQTALLDPNQQLTLLDRHAALDELQAAYTEAFADYRIQVDALEVLETRAREREEREGYLRYQLDEIDQIAPEEGEEEALVAERDRLQHAEELGRGCFTADASLTGGEHAALASVAEAVRVLTRLTTCDPSLTPLSERLDSVRIELDDVAASVRDYGRSVEANPRRLESVNTRLTALSRLKRRVGGDLTAVLAHAASLREERDGLERIGWDIDEARASRDTAYGLTMARAEALSEARHAAAARVSEEVTAELEGLAMPGGAFEVVFDRQETLSASGIDAVSFTIRTNPGEPFGALNRIASGGEVSRVLLALKRCFCRTDIGEAFVFDEVDAGVGGAVAEVVGLSLREIAREKQVIAITHLPQIAALGHHHLHVAKSETGERVSTTVTALDAAGRQDEVARMLAGQRITSRTRAHAAELLAAHAVRH